MIWLAATLTSAVIFTVLAVISKELMDHIDSINYTAIYSLMAFIFYTPVFLYYFLTTNTEFTPFLIGLTLLSGIGNILGMLAYNYGLQHTSLSIAMPLNRMQPVIVAVIGFLVLNEVMSLQKVGGILLVTFSSYVILMDDYRDPLNPLTNLVHDYGAQLAFVSAIFFSLTSVIDRFATVQILPEIYTYVILGTMAFTLNGFLMKKEPGFKEKLVGEISNHRRIYVLVGVLTATAYFMLYIGFSRAEASMVVPVLQLQVPLTVIAGKEVFDEPHIYQKLLGAAIMFAGLLLVI